MLTREQKIQFGGILEGMGESLDITETQFDAAVKSYNAVGGWLASDDSLLAPYNPTIQPQGSIIIGTTIKPVHKNDDIDIDLVCQLTGKAPSWTQKHLKEIVGEQLEKHRTYESILDKEGRRCWTLKYRENSEQKDKYHMDILPAIIKHGYKIVVEKAFSAVNMADTEKLSLSITDNTLKNYDIETEPYYWLKSNPFGYAKWFIGRATISGAKMFSLNEAVKPVPKYQKDKFPLQRVVQILKRHRDLMFDGDKEKPISVIITTLAAYAYAGETNVYDALINIIDKMHTNISKRVDELGREYRFIGNPVNITENFADKWRETPAKEEKFWRWLKTVKEDIQDSTMQKDTTKIFARLSKSFGEDAVAGAYVKAGENSKLITEQGNGRFDTKLGIVAGASNIIKPHTFYGAED